MKSKELDTSMQKTNLGLYFPPYTHSNQKQNTDLNVNPTAIKTLGENVRENLCDFAVSKDFLDITQVLPIKEKTDKLDFIKIQ